MAQRWFTRSFDGEAIRSWLAERWRLWVLLLGVALRLVEYLGDRPYWMDEGSLSANIVGHSPFEPPAPLAGDQLAPFGFLVVERVLGRLLGPSQMALRVLPLLAGLGAFLLLVRIQKTTLRPSARDLGLVLLALSPPMIYFTTELKPYIVDLAAACLCLSFPLGEELVALGPRRLIGPALIGALLLWFSFPVVFWLAAVGLGWLGSALKRRSWRLLASLALVGAVWLLSFAGAYVAAKRSLATVTSMWVFWGFAFPPRSALGAIAWSTRRLVNLFANPLHFETALGTALSSALGAGLALAGAVALGRRRLEFTARLVMPMVLAWFVAIVRFYPFHGRLLLHLVPALYLCLWEGAGLVRERLGRRLGIAWVVFLVVMPALEATYYLFEHRLRDFSPYGDLYKNPWL